MVSTHSILILSDDASNAELVGKLLAGNNRTIFLSLSADTRAADLREADPDVLVFVFEDVRDSEDCLAAVHAAAGGAVRAVRSGLILFCGKSDLQRAYELCRNQTFDDYVLFWPMSHDGARLPMVVEQALRRVGHQRRMAQVEDEPNVQIANRDDQILFVDDDPAQHVVLQAMLEGSGVTVRSADCATSAMSMLKGEVPRAILVDVNLPDMNGVDLVQWIRSEQSLVSTPVVMVTGHRERSIVLKAMSAGTNDFIAKPFTKGTLLSKLSRLGAIP